MWVARALKNEITHSNVANSSRVRLAVTFIVVRVVKSKRGREINSILIKKRLAALNLICCLYMAHNKIDV
jgi:hypothetical protein